MLHNLAWFIPPLLSMFNFLILVADCYNSLLPFHKLPYCSLEPWGLSKTGRCKDVGGRKKGELKVSERPGSFYFPKYMYIKRTWHRNRYRNIRNLGKRINNTVQNCITAVLQCFQNAFSDKNFRLVLVCSASRYLQLIYSTEPRFLGSYSLLVLHNEPGWPHPKV